MGVLIKNGTLVTSLDKAVGDILCRDGQIVAIGKDLEGSSDDHVIDASGQLVMPGGIDPHVHMELPFMGTVSADDFETGTAAGVAGGTTSIIDFVIPGRNDSYPDTLKWWYEKAEKSVADYAFHQAITWWGDDTADYMKRCVEEEGIPSFKTFMAYRGAIGIDDVEMIEAMKTARSLGAMITVHAEHGDMVVELQNKLFEEGHTNPMAHARSRPAPVEGEATARAIMLARMTREPVYIVHVTCVQAMEAIAEARKRGQTVYGETCPQYLLLDDSVYEKPDFEGAAYVMSPPIRPRGHQEPLWAALKSGTLQTVATDHCPFNQVGQKDAGKDDFRLIPNGAAGIENRMSLMYTYGVLEGRIDIHQYVDMMSTRAAKLFGMYPRKGSLTVGADADITVFDPESKGTISAKTHHHKVDRSIFEGFAIQGQASHVIVNGRVQFDKGDLKVERGAGRFIKRKMA